MAADFKKGKSGSGYTKKPQRGSSKASAGGGKSGEGGQDAQLKKITAPYNFVPLSSKVFFPDWAEQVSHDLPFADGICGELVCELVTDTPVYVRNGGKWQPGETLTNPDAQSFFRVGKNIMIPGTTLKGMLRNVIEIASFGKMNKVDNNRYSIRDLQNAAVYRDKMKDVRAGWLCRNAEDNSWSIIPSDYALVSHEMLKNDSIKKAQISLKKYESWGWNKLDVKFRYEKGSPHNRVTALGEGQSGTLVFTGQPTTNKGGKYDKKNEFVFFDTKESLCIAVSATIKKDIQFLYTNPNTGKPYEEWKHWSNQLEKGKRVPVFYQMDGEELGTFGFTRMYRLPYKYNIHDAIGHTSREHLDDSRLDLAEVIFGRVTDSKSKSSQYEPLKGRVSVCPAVASKAEPGKPIQTVLGAPKPSYYPNYIEQTNPDKQYMTFMDEDCRIRGWKRYPVRPLQEVLQPQQGTDNVATKLIPLKEGACFTFSVKLHNLRPVELGALAWALTWGGNTKLRHSLGMGKSMGYGVARISITSADVDWPAAMKAFEILMQQESGGDWLGTPQMEQLLAMADPSVTPQCGKLQHLTLAMGKGNQFVSAKGANLVLLPHVKPVAVDKHRNAPAGSNTNRSKPAQPVKEEVWQSVSLFFNPNNRVIIAKQKEDMTATLVLTPEFEKLIPAELLGKLKGKKKEAIASITVVPAGGKQFKITGIKQP